MGVIYGLRTVIFYVLLGLSALIWCSVSLLIAPFLPFPARYRFINVYWCRFAVGLGKYIIGLNYRVTGAENIPSERCVILAKHQSTWETFFLSAYFQPLSQVLKKELLRVPFFGWAMAMLKPIAINRDNPKQALKQLASQGAERLEQNCWVLIFPEGTRSRDGKLHDLKRGGFFLAVAAQVPIIPITIKGTFELMPRGRIFPRRGKIKVIFHPPVDTAGKTLADIPALASQVSLGMGT